jgi:hypothetical protein
MSKYSARNRFESLAGNPSDVKVTGNIRSSRFSGWQLYGAGFLLHPLLQFNKPIIGKIPIILIIPDIEKRGCLSSVAIRTATGHIIFDVMATFVLGENVINRCSVLV